MNIITTNIPAWCTRVVISICLLQLLSCEKFEAQDDPLEFQTSQDVTVPVEFIDCKLRTITHAYEGTTSGFTKGTFIYHPDGLPASLSYGDETGVGNLNFYFLYDSKRRLRQFRKGLDLNSVAYAVWHKYGFNSSNQIIVDTMYYPVAQSEVMDDRTRISHLTYDSQGRVIKEVVTNLKGVYADTRYYPYDSRGNLPLNGWPSSSFDNAVSIYRSNPVFQFIHRNYSKNNPTPQAAYNSKGLPLSATVLIDQFFNMVPNHVGGTGIKKATYDCDAAIPVNEFINCKLRTISHSGEGLPNGSLATGTFIYHPDGLPASLNYGDQATTTNPNHFFLYDSKRRLRQYRIGYSVNDPVKASWHKYGYNSSNQIIVDTLYDPDPAQAGAEDATRISHFVYDSQKRVIKETIKKLDGTISQTINYSYDSRGNLVVNGWNASSYDNSVSVFRTNPVFQFIHRNYSQNNSASQARYNSKGLPLSSVPCNDDFFNISSSLPGGSGVAKLNYDCR